LITHCAPTLARMKTGSLFNLACPNMLCLKGEMDHLTPLLKEKGVGLTVLREKDGRFLLYLYRTQELKKTLQDQDTWAFLRQYGYDTPDVDEAIGHLRQRLSQSDDFPHEIGVFLGYPLTDIQGFICNEGRNCLCCGYWKVYSDPTAAQRTFSRYRKCTEAYMRLFAEGCPLSKLTVHARPA
ncbi:MAG: DUF3793 family protein, partial [Clostridia bacterium]|nr:DUF3793 family protein [Clostridia bacterium]